MSALSLYIITVYSLYKLKIAALLYALHKIPENKVFFCIQEKAIFLFKALTRNQKIGNMPIRVLPYMWRLG